MKSKYSEFSLLRTDVFVVTRFHSNSFLKRYVETLSLQFRVQFPICEFFGVLILGAGSKSRSRSSMRYV